MSRTESLEGKIYTPIANCDCVLILYIYMLLYIQIHLCCIMMEGEQDKTNDVTYTQDNTRLYKYHTAILTINTITKAKKHMKLYDNHHKEILFPEQQLLVIRTL